MPSFDIESKVEEHELSNAVENANREITNRFDFKGVDATIELTKETITLTAPEEFQTSQMQDILHSCLTKRSIDIQILDPQPLDKNLAQAKMVNKLKQGIDKESAKKVVKFIKAAKYKVQASIQGDTVRVTGKKRDDLQTVMAGLRGEEFGLPLQFDNFRD
jgi:uncharacterized protein YajQ (UPF0234 family)